MKAQEPELPTAFDEFPRGATFAGPYPVSANREFIVSTFTQYHGRPPAAVLWVKPGMWIAGPVTLAIAENGDAGPEPTAGAEVGSAPAAPVEQTTSEDLKAPLSIIAAGPGRADQWTQPSLI